MKGDGLASTTIDAILNYLGWNIVAHHGSQEGRQIGIHVQRQFGMKEILTALSIHH
jgi:hypothetical protein